jgi:5-methylcytosine-specific restriction endonuclease McrA
MSPAYRIAAEPLPSVTGGDGDGAPSDHPAVTAPRNPLAREKVGKTPRKAMTPARRARLLEKHGHVCAFRGCGVTSGLELDHIIPLALGGPDDDANLRPFCSEHHKAKTARDLGAIAKAKRLAGETCTGPKAKIRSRGFDKTHTKKLDGSVVRKETRHV